MLSVRAPAGHHRVALAGRRSVPCAGLAARRPAAHLLAPPVRGLGGDAVDGFLDLAKLLSGSSGSGKKTPYDNLAAAVGKDVYVDVAGWHLYMRDMSGVQGLKMSQVLAATLGPKAKQGLKKADVEEFLRKVPIKLGQGKLQVSLFDVMPSACVSDLVRLVQDHADD